MIFKYNTREFNSENQEFLLPFILSLTLHPSRNHFTFFCFSVFTGFLLWQISNFPPLPILPLFHLDIEPYAKLETSLSSLSYWYIMATRLNSSQGCPSSLRSQMLKMKMMVICFPSFFIAKENKCGLVSQLLLSRWERYLGGVQSSENKQAWVPGDRYGR